MRVALETKDAGALPVELKTALEKFERSVEGFKSSNDERIKGIEKKFDDVVKREEVDRIAAAVEETKKEFNEAFAKLQRSGAGKDDEAEKKLQQLADAESKAWDTYIRKGRMEGDRAFEEAKSLASKLELKDLSTVIAEDGGYMVHPQYEADMIEIIEQISDLRPILGQTEIGSRELIVPVDTGGWSASWVAELEARSKTTAGTVQERRFVADEIYAFPRLTQVMLEDGVFDVDAWLMKKVTEAIAREEGKAFINGDGNKKPKGILQQTIVANASWSWGKLGYIATGAAADFAPSYPGASPSTAASNGADCLIDLVYAIDKRFRGNADWVMNKKTLGKVRKLKDGDGQYLFRDALTQSGLITVLLGYPVTEAEDMPDVGAGNFPIIFGDFNEGYLVVDRTGITVKRDDITEMGFVKVYVRRRVGGDVADYQALKLLKVAAS